MSLTGSPISRGKFGAKETIMASLPQLPGRMLAPAFRPLNSSEGNMRCDRAEIVNLLSKIFGLGGKYSANVSEVALTGVKFSPTL